MSVGRMNPGNVTSSVNQDSMSQIEDELESNRTVITDDDGELLFFSLILQKNRKPLSLSVLLNFLSLLDGFTHEPNTQFHFQEVLLGS